MEPKKFQKFYIDKNEIGKIVSSWGALFGSRYIHIEDYLKKSKLYVNIPDDTHVVYKPQDIIKGLYTVSKGAEIMTHDFTLNVYVHEYNEPSIEKSDGNLDFISNSMSSSIIIPYRMAIDIMKFMEKFSRVH